MTRKTFYKKLRGVKNKFRWSFGIKGKTNNIRCEIKGLYYCPIEAIFYKDDYDDTIGYYLGSAYFLSIKYNIEGYSDIMIAADNDMKLLTPKRKAIRRTLLKILQEERVK